MTMTQRDRRALVLLGVIVVLILVYRAVSDDGTEAPAVVAAKETTEQLELKLRRLRQSMARVPGKQEVLNAASAELAAREKHLFDGETVNQAQAQILEVVRKAARNAGLEVRGTEFSPVRPFGDAYGEVGVTVTAEAPIEQLVNLMADLANERQLIATNELRIVTANRRQKTVSIRLNVSGLVPRKFVPEKKA